MDTCVAPGNEVCLGKGFPKHWSRGRGGREPREQARTLQVKGM